LSRLARIKISISALYANERFEAARQYSILHLERIVGNSWRWDFFLLVRHPSRDEDEKAAALIRPAAAIDTGRSNIAAIKLA
jgi:hypothetical protein